MNTNKFVSQALTGLIGAVIALVAVACVTLLPLRAQSGASSTTCDDAACTCQSNMRQLSIALAEYSQDYDGIFPSGHQGPPSAGVGWFGPVSDYDTSRADYHCPSDPTNATKPIYALSYGYNADLSGVHNYQFTAPDLTVAAFELSGTPILARVYDEGASQGAMLFSAASDGTDGHLLAGKKRDGRSGRRVRDGVHRISDAFSIGQSVPLPRSDGTIGARTTHSRTAMSSSSIPMTFRPARMQRAAAICRRGRPTVKRPVRWTTTTKRRSARFNLGE